MGTGAERIDFNKATLGEVFQAIGVFNQSVPVTLDGPVRSQTMPTRGGATRNLTTDSTSSTDPVQVVASDPRRARVQVWCTGVPVFIGFDAGTVRSGNAAILPVGQIFTTSCTDALMVRSTAGAAVVSYACENWAD